MGDRYLQGPLGAPIDELGRRQNRGNLVGALPQSDLELEQYRANIAEMERIRAQRAEQELEALKRRVGYRGGNLLIGTEKNAIATPPPVEGDVVNGRAMDLERDIGRLNRSMAKQLEDEKAAMADAIQTRPPPTNGLTAKEIRELEEATKRQRYMIDLNPGPPTSVGEQYRQFMEQRLDASMGVTPEQQQQAIARRRALYDKPI